MNRLKLKLMEMYRSFYNLFFDRPIRLYVPTGLKALDEITARSRKPTDFSDHMVPLFTETLMTKPRVIVELGTRGGESTQVFAKAAELYGSTLLSIDIDDCSGSCSYPKWNFVKSDDVAFAKEFQNWCKARNLEPEVDLLFIDTSHLYEHTVQEINAWLPLVSKRGKAIFHDTNLRRFSYHENGRLDYQWDNQRGVVRAIEEYLDCQWNEKVTFTDVRKGWLIRHRPFCNGLTVLERLGEK